jgi:hypothetical protein
LTLYGPAGFCIPIGIPVVWAVGILLYEGWTPAEKGEKAKDVESRPETTDEDPVGYNGDE